MLVDIIRRAIKNNSYKYNATLVFGSKILITLLTFISTPLITRYYTPSNYGEFAIINSIVLNATLFANLSLPIALIAYQKSKAIKIMALALRTSLIIAVISALILLLTGNFLIEHTAINKTRVFLWLVPAFVFINSCTELFASYNILVKNFRKNVIVNLSENFSNKLTSLGLGFAGMNATGLVISLMLGKSINFFVQLTDKSLRRDFMDSIRLGSSRHKIYNKISGIENYPLYQTPLIFLTRLVSQFFIWFLALYYNKAELGYYSIAVSLLTIPFTLFSSSLQPIITRKLADLNKSMLVHSYRKLVMYSVAISFVTYFSIFILADWLITLYLGDTWIGAIPYVEILCISFGALLIGDSVSGIYIVSGQQKFNLKIKVFFTALTMTLAVSTQLMFGNLLWVIFVYAIMVLLEQMFRVIAAYFKISNVNYE